MSKIYIVTDWLNRSAQKFCCEIYNIPEELFFSVSTCAFCEKRNDKGPPEDQIFLCFYINLWPMDLHATKTFYFRQFFFVYVVVKSIRRVLSLLKIYFKTVAMCSGPGQVAVKMNFSTEIIQVKIHWPYSVKSFRTRSKNKFVDKFIRTHERIKSFENNNQKFPFFSLFFFFSEWQWKGLTCIWDGMKS